MVIALITITACGSGETSNENATNDNTLAAVGSPEAEAAFAKGNTIHPLSSVRC